VAARARLDHALAYELPLRSERGPAPVTVPPSSPRPGHDIATKILDAIPMGARATPTSAESHVVVQPAFA
jgi:hypothetical protein